MAIKHEFRWKNPGNLGEVKTRIERLTPSKAIRFFCYECYGFCEKAGEEIKNCPSETCALWPFRRGHAHTGKRPSGASQTRPRAEKSTISPEPIPNQG